MRNALWICLLGVAIDIAACSTPRDFSTVDAGTPEFDAEPAPDLAQHDAGFLELDANLIDAEPADAVRTDATPYDGAPADAPPTTLLRDVS